MAANSMTDTGEITTKSYYSKELLLFSLGCFDTDLTSERRTLEMSKDQWIHQQICQIAI
jgi:hypothetical protein